MLLLLGLIFVATGLFGVGDICGNGLNRIRLSGNSVTTVRKIINNRLRIGIPFSSPFVEIMHPDIFPKNRLVVASLFWVLVINWWALESQTKQPLKPLAQ